MDKYYYKMNYELLMLNRLYLLSVSDTISCHTGFLLRVRAQNQSSSLSDFTYGLE